MHICFVYADTRTGAQGDETVRGWRVWGFGSGWHKSMRRTHSASQGGKPSSG